MTPDQLQTLISIIGAVFVLGGVGGVAWLAASELRLRAIRRGRMQTVGGPHNGSNRSRNKPSTSTWACAR
jgi:hypothetical protein